MSVLGRVRRCGVVHCSFDLQGLLLIDVGSRTPFPLSNSKELWKGSELAFESRKQIFGTSAGDFAIALRTADPNHHESSMGVSKVGDFQK
jgi:hypothetical protein